jgi:hypothetical protein
VPLPSTIVEKVAIFSCAIEIFLNFKQFCGRFATQISTKSSAKTYMSLYYECQACVTKFVLTF